VSIVVFPWILGFIDGLPWMTVTFQMIKSCWAFYLYLPTMVSTFSFYAFARTWDLTWGNRPSTDVSYLQRGLTAQDKEKFKERIRAAGQNNLAKLLLANVVLILAGIAYTSQNNQIQTLILAIIIFVAPIIQMIFSIIYYVYYWICVKCRPRCDRRVSVRKRIERLEADEKSPMQPKL